MQLQYKTVKFTAFLLGLLWLQSCGEASSTDSDVTDSDKPVQFLSGSSTNMEGKPMYLHYLSSKAMEPLDTITVDEEGNFEVMLSDVKEGFYRLSVGPQQFITLVYSNGEDIELYVDGNSFGSNYTVEGSSESSRMKDLNVMLLGFNQQNMQLNNKAKAAYQQNNVAEYQKYVAQQQALSQVMFDSIANFVRKDPGSLTSLAAVQNLKMEDYFDLYEEVDKALAKTRPESEFYKAIHERVESSRKLSVGKQAPEIQLNNLEGEEVPLSSLRGKVVLIDFWASWCMPCMKEMPNVKNVYERYKSEGFEIYGVSLDKNKSSWQGAIDRMELDWVHVSDLGYWQSSVVPIYNVRSIPLTYLVGRDGTILAKNLRGTELESKLKEIFET